jgi:hydroxypyruvate reductase
MCDEPDSLPAFSRSFLLSLFRAALSAADPAHCLEPHLGFPPPAGKTLVVGAGKAAASMARAVEAAWPDRPLSGLVVTRYGHALPTRRIEVVEAAHPVPDAAGEAAARRILQIARSAGPDDLVLVLISGGGSSLLSIPGPGLSLEDIQTVNRALLRSGAPISAINTVRKHMSAVKGGRLAAAAAPAQMLTLLISDVPGDDPAVIASGPTVPDPTTCADARHVLELYGVSPPEAVSSFLLSSAAETPKPGDACFANCHLRLVATPAMALAAAAAAATKAGVRPVILGDALEGEARGLADVHASLALALSAGPGGGPCARAGADSRPCVLLSGGECTVTVRGRGRGGPNAEYAAQLALALGGASSIAAIACDTDGIDGSEDNAGAVIGPHTLQRALARDVDIPALLAANDSYRIFQTLGDLIVCGPTYTNVNDFRAILISETALT